MLWSVPDLSPATVPLLGADEPVRASVSGVGLYNGDAKSSEHANGVVYLTSKRLIYVDSAHPILNSVQVQTSQVKGVTYTPRFLKASAKISLEVLPDDSGSSSDAKNRNWACAICSFSNSGDTSVCATCGVRAQEDTSFCVQETEPLEPGVCPHCTFKNHPSVRFCEMCGASLKLESSLASSLGTHIKISFRKGGSHNFYERLENAVNAAPASKGDAKASEPKKKTLGFGIRTLQARNQDTQIRVNEILDSAASSSANFKERLAEVVAIAERLVVPKEGSLPIIVGIDGDNSEGLARQLADLLVGKDLLSRAGGMISLHDAFALYNRCRGFGLISAAQLLAALELCESLDLPLRVRTLQSGLKVVETRGGLDQALQRLLHWIKQESSTVVWRESSGFSARDVSDKFGCSVQVALEELTLAEERGKLCRDEHTSGLRFFPNLLIESAH